MEEPAIPSDAPTSAAALALLRKASDLLAARELEAALPLYRQYLEHRPDDASALINTGATLIDLHRHAEAEPYYRRALALRPNDRIAVAGTAICLARAFRVEDAIALTEEMLRHNADDPEAWGNYASLLARVDRLKDAEAAFTRGLDLAPHSNTLRKGRGLVRLGLGDYRGGFGDRMRAIYRHGAAPGRELPFQGADLTGRSVLVWSEEGNGDCLALARFIPRLISTGGRIVVASRPLLRRLFETIPGVREVVPDTVSRRKYDYALPALSLPNLFGATIDTLPPPVPVTVPQDSLERGRAFLRDHRDTLNVGFCWSGSTGFIANYVRAVSLDRFLPLARVPGVRLFSLYKGNLLDAYYQHPISDLTTDTASSDRDFADAAGTIAALDLIVTTDTCIAHIAGTLGKPTWLLLPVGAYYYYPLSHGDRTPWYPSMRLIRQTVPGDWDAVFATVERDLTALAAERMP